MPEWLGISLTRVSPADADGESSYDASSHTGAPDVTDGPVAGEPAEPAQQRARYSTSWPAGNTGPPPQLGEGGDSSLGLTPNQWALLASFGVALFVGLALVVGVVVGRGLRAPTAAQASTAVPVGESLAVVDQSVAEAPADSRVHPRPISGEDEGGVSLLFDSGPTSGDAAPHFELEALSGGSLSLDALKGQVVLINFWATWCTWCRYELPGLQAVYEKYKDQGLVVVGVDVEEHRPLVEAYVQRYNLSFPVVLDVDGSTAETYRVRALPMTFFVDRDGEITQVRRGAMREDELERYARRMLSED